MSSHYIYFESNPILDPLVENWRQIRDEFFARLYKELGDKHKLEDDNTPGQKSNYVTDTFKTVLYQGNFKAMPIFLRDKLIDSHEAKQMNWQNWQKPGGAKTRFWEERMNAMPTIKQWLDKYIDIVGAVTYNICLPGSRLNHHWGLAPEYLRLHLTLKEAEGCVFDIENERKQWVDGELFAFDDCNVLHGTRHTGTEPRTIVLIDILKSQLQSYAKTWPCREFIPREQRSVPLIENW